MSGSHVTHEPPWRRQLTISQEIDGVSSSVPTPTVSERASDLHIPSVCPLDFAAVAALDKARSKWQACIASSFSTITRPTHTHRQTHTHTHASTLIGGDLLLYTSALPIYSRSNQPRWCAMVLADGAIVGASNETCRRPSPKKRANNSRTLYALCHMIQPSTIAAPGRRLAKRRPGASWNEQLR